MAELDSLIDSIIHQRNVPKVSYIDEKNAKIFKLKDIPPRGQGLFAERFLSVKEPICSLACPTITAIDSDFIQTTCYHCLIITAAQLPLHSWGHASTELKTCNGCHFARFCNKDCQVKSWHAYHKYECRIYKKLQSNMPPALFRAVMRMVLLRDRKILPEDDWNRAVALTSHEQMLIKRGRSNLSDMAVGIKHLSGSEMSVETIQQLVFIMKLNATEIPSLIYGGIGVMLDPLIGKINHSCEPNIAIRRPQYTMVSSWRDSVQLSQSERESFVQIIPLRDIAAGEELLNCYVAPTVSVKDRRARLIEDYLFECKCLRCLSDLEAIKILAGEQPNLPTQFEQWTKNVMRHLSQAGQKSDALKKASTTMENSERYLKFPVLYSTGDYPQIIMAFILESLKRQALDEALINALRLDFLVNPPRFVGRHNPTNIYTIFLVLDILDGLLMISPSSENQAENTAKCLQNLQDRGLSKNGLIYWRHRICADLRKRLENSAAKDLLDLVERREKQMKQLDEGTQDLDNERMKKEAELEMSTALKLKEPQWTSVLAQNGC